MSAVSWVKIVGFEKFKIMVVHFDLIMEKMKNNIDIYLFSMILKNSQASFYQIIPPPSFFGTFGISTNRVHYVNLTKVCTEWSRPSLMPTRSLFLALRLSSASFLRSCSMVILSSKSSIFSRSSVFSSYDR